MNRPGHRATRARSRGAATALLLGLIALAASCGKDDSPTAPTPAPASLVASGWVKFEQGAFAAAQGDFEGALAQDAALAEAHLGRSWCLLLSAGAQTDYAAAEAAFDLALAQGETSAATWAGRAAARLGRGGEGLSGAAADAAEAIAREPAFRFTHRTGFDATDVRLILAQAKAGLGDFPGALAAVQADCPLDVRPDDPSGWTVAGTRFESYESAVLAWLQEIGAVAAP